MPCTGQSAPYDSTFHCKASRYQTAILDSVDVSLPAHDIRRRCVLLGPGYS